MDNELEMKVTMLDELFDNLFDIQELADPSSDERDKLGAALALISEVLAVWEKELGGAE